jgi:1,4-dihydroxy-2-naphthoate octaprenyltransferase
LAYLVPLLTWLTGHAPSWVLFTWLSLPLLKPLIYQVLHEKGRPLNLALAGTARLELIYSFLFSVGLLL